MKIVPLTLDRANMLVNELHRHHKSAVGHRFSIGLVNEEGVLIGAAIVGRPVARNVDQYSVAEITRLVTDGTRNACSALYGACARVAKEMGFVSIQKYILGDEPGTSLKASGWALDGLSDGGDWNRPSRNGRRLDQPMVFKQKWTKALQKTVNGHVGNSEVTERLFNLRYRELLNSL
jgi:hypothetical protein